MGLLPLAVLLLAAPLRAASLSEASEEAKAMAKLIKENPCYHNIELSVRSIQAAFAAGRKPHFCPTDNPPASVRLHHDRACKVIPGLGGTSAERLYVDAEGGEWGVRLITQRGSDSTWVEIVRSFDDRATWRVQARLGMVPTAELLANAILFRTILALGPMPQGMNPTPQITQEEPYDVTLETIPFEHPD